MWHAVPGATSYEFELLSESGEVLATQVTTDTVASPLAQVDQALLPGARWWVVARLTGGGTVRSELRAFSAPK